MIKTVMKGLYKDLGDVVLALLKNTETREHVLEYLGEVINKNSSRAHIQVIFPSLMSLLYNYSLQSSLTRILCNMFLRLNRYPVQVLACLSTLVLSCFGFVIHS